MLILTKSGIVYSCGKNNHNSNGCLGTGKTTLKKNRPTNQTEPQRITKMRNQKFFEIEKIIDIKCGISHSVFLTVHKQALICGSGEFGNIGNGRRCDNLKDAIYVPTMIPCKLKSSCFVNQNLTQIECGETHTLLLNDLGDIYTFGSMWNSERQSFPPKIIPYFQGIFIDSIFCGRYINRSYAVSDFGKVYFWDQVNFINRNCEVQPQRVEFGSNVQIHHICGKKAFFQGKVVGEGDTDCRFYLGDASEVFPAEGVERSVTDPGLVDIQQKINSHDRKNCEIVEIIDDTMIVVRLKE